MSARQKVFVWAAVATLFVAGACTTQATDPTMPPGSPTPSPVAPPSPEAAAASAALAAYTEYWRVTDAALASPGEREWKLEIEQVARGSALQGAVADLENYRSIPAHTVGSIRRSPQVAEATPSRVAIVDCVDVSDANLVADDSGEPLVDAANQPPRFRMHATVVAVGDRWFVDESTPALDEPC